MPKISVERNQLPAGWRVEKVADIGQWASGGTPSIKDETLWSGDIPWISAKDMKIPRLRDASDHVSTKAIGNGTRLIPPGSLLMVVRGMILAHTFPVALAESPLAFNQDLKALIPREDLSSEYLLYWFQTNKETILSIADEATHGTKRIPTSALFNLPIYLPPPNEQRAIASALSDMDALLAKLDQLIAKKRDIKQAAMQELLTGRRRLPGFSGGWTVTALRNLGAWKGGATPSMANPDFWVNGDVPWASSGDIKSTTIDATAKNITELAVESSSTTVVPTGSVVMVTRSGILRRYLPVAKTSKPIAINQDIKALIPASGVDTEFVLQSLLLHGPDILSSCMKAGTTVESVELSWLKAYEIDLPSLDEQQAIAALLRDMAAEITALEARREKTRLIKQGMMQELLSGRVRLN
jgi:type I restriction enzyme, S subunit